MVESINIIVQLNDEKLFIFCINREIGKFIEDKITENGAFNHCQSIRNVVVDLTQ